MDEEESLKEADIIYKSLKMIDKECRSHFNDNDITSEEYFKYGILSDLVRNMITFNLIRTLYGLRSPGLNLNCRLILESLVILKKYENNEFTKDNYDLYKEGYALIEVDNEKHLFKDENIKWDALKETKEKEQIYLEKWSKKFGIDKTTLSVVARDSCFYLAPQMYIDYGLAHPGKIFHYSFVGLINNTLGFQYGDYYTFFGFLLHPTLISEDVIDEVESVKDKSYLSVFTLACNYLKEKGLIHDNDLEGFFAEKMHGVIKDNLYVTDKIIVTLNGLNYECSHKDGVLVNDFIYRMVQSINDILADMLICNAYGHTDQIISKFKIFMEYISMYHSIDIAGKDLEYHSFVRCFYISTSYQLSQLIPKLMLDLNPNTTDNDFAKFAINKDDELKQIYNDCYKEKFSYITEEFFVSGVKMHVLYFINGCHPAKNYGHLVGTFINSFFASSERADIFALTHMSTDLCHSAGYAFNASDRTFYGAASQALAYAFIYLRLYYENLKKHAAKKRYSEIVFPADLFDVFIKVEEAFVDDCLEKVGKIMNNDGRQVKP
ncbi:MAG: hypothetical protein MJ206_02265 [Bacilli bacterium]|nr:hypothetical protein [Bacilli bacterium]